MNVVVSPAGTASVAPPPPRSPARRRLPNFARAGDLPIQADATAAGTATISERRVFSQRPAGRVRQQSAIHRERGRWRAYRKSRRANGPPSSQPGAPPQASPSARRQGLKARLIGWVAVGMNRTFSPASSGEFSWGVAPGWDELRLWRACSAKTFGPPSESGFIKPVAAFFLRARLGGAGVYPLHRPGSPWENTASTVAFGTSS